MCQRITSGDYPIHLLRYNLNTRTVFILAGVTESIEILIFPKGQWRFNDDDTIEALINRGDPNAHRYPFPQTGADLTEMGEILKRKLRGNRSG